MSKEDYLKEERAEILRLSEAWAKSVDAMRQECPGCGKAFEINLREALSSYPVQMSITPAPGRTLDAKTVGNSIVEMSKMFEAIGDDFGHRTSSVLLGVTVNDEMATEITMGFMPVRMDKNTPADPNG